MALKEVYVSNHDIYMITVQNNYNETIYLFKDTTLFHFTSAYSSQVLSNILKIKITVLMIRCD